MAALKRIPVPHTPKSTAATGLHASALTRVMSEFKDLVKSFETGLRRSLDDCRSLSVEGHDLIHPARQCHRGSDCVRLEACRLAISDLSAKYMRKYIRTSLDAAECEGKRLEEQLQNLSFTTCSSTTSSNPNSFEDIAQSRNHREDWDEDEDTGHDRTSNNNREGQLGGLHHGHFRLYSTELFDLLGQPTELRLGTLRFHKHSLPTMSSAESSRVTVELALNNSFFIADSIETLPYHSFRLPSTPSLQNRGILSRKPEDEGAFPAFDSWLLFTFLGNGCIKVEVPVEMCADVYGDKLRGRENEEVLFWGLFVDDDDVNDTDIEWSY